MGSVSIEGIELFLAKMTSRNVDNARRAEEITCEIENKKLKMV